MLLCIFVSWDSLEILMPMYRIIENPLPCLHPLSAISKDEKKTGHRNRGFKKVWNSEFSFFFSSQLDHQFASALTLSFQSKLSAGIKRGLTTREENRGCLSNGNCIFSNCIYDKCPLYQVHLCYTVQL